MRGTACVYALVCMYSENKLWKPIVPFHIWFMGSNSGSHAWYQVPLLARHFIGLFFFPLTFFFSLFVNLAYLGYLLQQYKANARLKY